MKLNKLILSLILYCFAGCAAWANEVTPYTADAALEKLMQGNARFVHHRLKHPDQKPSRMAELVQGQHPFAVVLGCSDSRIPPEVLFDQGLGDIFVIRVAGNILSDDVIGSIEYGIEHLGTPLVLVLGHEKCGAVTAAVENVDTGCSHEGCLINAIKPAVQISKNQKGDLVDVSIHNNVKLVVENLKKSKPIIADSIEHGKVKVIGAYYHLDSGKVDLMN